MCVLYHKIDKCVIARMHSSAIISSAGDRINCVIELCTWVHIRQSIHRDIL